jgi:uncharacterized paraquat-inducible protein A
LSDTPEPVGDRRDEPDARLAHNAMRCEDCGIVWYSAVAELTASWASCVRCGGTLHTERRAAAPVG